LQALYLAGQIGKSGVITSLAIYVSGYPTITLPNIRSGGAHAVKQPVQPVGRGRLDNGVRIQLNIGAVGWYYFKLATNFAYNGASNLLVIFP
jgi:hypothetical protein